MSTIQLGFDHDYSIETLRDKHGQLYKDNSTKKCGNFSWEKTWQTSNSTYGQHECFNPKVKDQQLHDTSREAEEQKTPGVVEPFVKVRPPLGNSANRPWRAQNF